jgi:hypothetical protein
MEMVLAPVSNEQFIGYTSLYLELSSEISSIRA